MMKRGLAEDVARAAREAFPEIPFPGRKDEYWRFSDREAWGANALFPFFTAQIGHVGSADFDALERRFCSMPDSLAVCDGVEIFADFDGSKIEVCALSEAAEKYPENFESLYSGSRGKFDILPATRAGCGLYIKVKAGARARLNMFECSKLPLSISAAVFDVGEGASLALLRKTAVYGGSFRATRASFLLAEGAKLECASFSFGGLPARKYAREDFRLGAGAQVSDAYAELGEEETRIERNFALCAPNASVDSRVFSAARGAVARDIRTSQEHLCPDCRSNVAVRTALYDDSKLAFSGLIRVEEAAQRTDAYLSSRSLLMSDAAKAQVSPILEICANDVSCSHGCTVAKPDEEQLFYMRSRGLDLPEAKRLIVEGFAESSFSHIADEALRASLGEHANLF